MYEEIYGKLATYSFSPEYLLNESARRNATQSQHGDSNGEATPVVYAQASVFTTTACTIALFNRKQPEWIFKGAT